MNTVTNFIKVLAENKRLIALPEISTLFDAFKADYEKEIEVDVTSATDLSDKQQHEISWLHLGKTFGT